MQVYTVKSVTLSYILSKNTCCKLQFIIKFENLFTYTKYKGYDPEATIYTDNNSQTMRRQGAYPNPKSVFFTIDLIMKQIVLKIKRPYTCKVVLL
jgi:hypothetical protein